MQTSLSLNLISQAMLVVDTQGRRSREKQQISDYSACSMEPRPRWPPTVTLQVASGISSSSTAPSPSPVPSALSSVLPSRSPPARPIPRGPPPDRRRLPRRTASCSDTAPAVTTSDRIFPSQFASIRSKLECGFLLRLEQSCSANRAGDTTPRDSITPNMLLWAPSITSAFSSGSLEAIVSPKEPRFAADVCSSAVMALRSGISKTPNALSYLRRSQGGQSNALSTSATTEAAEPELEPLPAFATVEV